MYPGGRTPHGQGFLPEVRAPVRDAMLRADDRRMTGHEAAFDIRAVIRQVPCQAQRLARPDNRSESMT
jgi:hypothetical protein